MSPLLRTRPPASEMKLTLLSATSITSALSFLLGTHAWGQGGTLPPPPFSCSEGTFPDRANYLTAHAIVATVAELHLDPTILPTLCSIINPKKPGEPCYLTSVASWADQFKGKRDTSTFFSSEKIYKSLGITWKRGILLGVFPPSSCLLYVVY